MRKITINDWQTIQSRKEIQNIRRIVRSDKSINWSIVFELFLIVLGFCFDNVFTDKQAPQWVWVAISVTALVVPVLVFVGSLLSQKRKKESEKQVKDAHEVITMFDDELCYYVMTAGSLFDSKPDETGTNTIDDQELLRFYYIEVSYYLNKSVSILYLMINNLSNLVEMPQLNVRHPSSKIAFHRFQNVILLMSTMYQKIEAHLANSVDMQDVLKENRWYVLRMNEVISQANSSLHANIPKLQLP